MKHEVLLLQRSEVQWVRDLPVPHLWTVAPGNGAKVPQKADQKTQEMAVSSQFSWVRGVLCVIAMALWNAALIWAGLRFGGGR